MIGKTLGHYRMIEKLGAGGMGDVYLARDEQLQRDVAITILPAGTLADDTARKRFRKVFANGDWRTGISQPSSNFDPTKISSDASSATSRCLSWTPDVCSSLSPVCQPTTEPPTPALGAVMAVPQVGGLHHRYSRAA